MNFKRSPESRALEALFKAMQPGEVVTFGEASTRLNFNVADHLGASYRVRDRLRKAGDMCIVEERHTFRRLTDEEAVLEEGARFTRKAGNATRRGVGAVSSADYEKLQPSTQREYNATVSMLGTVRQFVNKMSRKKIQEATDKAEASLPTRDVLRLFRKGNF